MQLNKVFLLLFMFVALYADSKYSCTAEYIIQDNKKYLPPQNLKYIDIIISADKEFLTFITQNMQSSYNYKSFIKPTKTMPSIGISYESNERFVDLFNDNTLYFGFIESGHIIKAKCPSMNLNLKEVKFTPSGKIVYGFPIENFPKSGDINIFIKNNRVAPLKIYTSNNSNYFVKLKDYVSKKTIMTIFIKGGDSIETKVPLGTYEIVYASGINWHDDEKLFGKNTTYTKANQLFTFRENDNGINGYTLKLYSVSNGNLQTKKLNKNEF